MVSGIWRGDFFQLLLVVEETETPLSTHLCSGIEIPSSSYYTRDLSHLNEVKLGI